MWKACSKCGKIHSTNYKCIKYKTIYETTEERKQRSSYSWTKKSQDIKEQANHLCEVCKDRGVYTYNDLEVHHIEKLRDGGDLLDDDNLICLCVEHHKQADNNEIDKEYLKQLAKNRGRGIAKH